MEKVEAWLVDCRLSGCQAIQKAWFAQFVSSPERHGGVRCMKRKLNLPLRGHFQRKICIMWWRWGRNGEQWSLSREVP